MNQTNFANVEATSGRRLNESETCRIVDSLTDVGDIRQIFAAKYRVLYTSVPYSVPEMQEFLRNAELLTIRLAGASISADYIYNVNDVKKAVSKLKPHKREGSSELSFDKFINAGINGLP